MNKDLKKDLLKILNFIKKISIVVLSTTGLIVIIIPIVGIWLFWQVSTVNGLYYRVDLKQHELGMLFFCKEKAEEKHPEKDQVYRKGVHDLTANYKFQVQAGYCPANKDEAKNIEHTRIKLCKEVKSDLEKAARKSFGKPLRSAKQRYDEDFVAKGSCPPYIKNY